MYLIFFRISNFEIKIDQKPLSIGGTFGGGLRPLHPFGLRATPISLRWKHSINSFQNVMNMWITGDTKGLMHYTTICIRGHSEINCRPARILHEVGVWQISKNLYVQLSKWGMTERDSWQGGVCTHDTGDMLWEHIKFPALIRLLYWNQIQNE